MKMSRFTKEEKNKLIKYHRKVVITPSTYSIEIGDFYGNIPYLYLLENNGSYGVLTLDISSSLTPLFKTWDSRKDGKITRYKRQEFTLLSLGILAGIVSLGVLYGYIFRGDYPLWLISLNVLVFILGTTGRILLINGKSLAQYIYVVREFVELGIFISMLALGLATGSFWIRLASILSSMIILLKGVVNWSYEARNQDM